MSSTPKKIHVLGNDIRIIQEQKFEFISITDMLQSKEGNFFITDWLRNRNTLEYIGIWESIYNPDFNYGEFAIIKTKAGLNNFRLSVKEWVERTHAIGIKSSAGRYGGTFAHPDIAFEFGMWISAEFKIYLVKEFARLKQIENDQTQEWDIQRTISKINYRIHTDAIKENLIPKELSKEQMSYVYASEADMLNMALFGKTARQWKENNQTEHENIRGEATIHQLVVLSNLESINALLIAQGHSQQERLTMLNKVAITQMKSLMKNKKINQLANAGKKLTLPSK